MWNRTLQKEEVAELSDCQSSVSNGKVISWKESRNLWITSNVTIDKFGKTADHILCRRNGAVKYIIQKNSVVYFTDKNINDKILFQMRRQNTV